MLIKIKGLRIVFVLSRVSRAKNTVAGWTGVRRDACEPEAGDCKRFKFGGLEVESISERFSVNLGPGDAHGAALMDRPGGGPRPPA